MTAKVAAGGKSWLAAFASEVETFLSEEAPTTLIEFPVAEETRSRLFREVGAVVPWVTGWREHRAAIAVAAVQVASEAKAGNEAYVHHFLDRIGRTAYRPAWDNDYGPAIESFFEAGFDEPSAVGPWRYVRTIYQHAGVILVGMESYAELLDRLLAGGGQFTWHEYLQEAARATSTLIRPFLNSHAGYRFTRTTGEYVRRHRRGELPTEDLEGLRGYRRGFWRELLQHLHGEVGLSRVDAPTFPVLAIDLERCQLVLRFPSAWQARGVYRVNGHAVTYTEQRVGTTAPVIQIRGGPPMNVDHWWGPGLAPVAVFRATDGVFIGSATPGEGPKWTLRAGSYVIIADSDLDARLEGLRAIPLGQLDVVAQDYDQPAHSIWHVEISGHQALAELGLRVVGRQLLPTLSFMNPDRHWHPLGRSVFSGTLPEVQIHHWTADFVNEFAVRLAVNGVERELALSGDSFRLAVGTACKGRVWLERRGFTSTPDDFASLDFTVLPAGAGVSVVEDMLSPTDLGHVRATFPEGWRLQPLQGDALEQRNATWRIPASRGVFDAILSAPTFELPISLRLPVVSLRSRAPGAIVWLESLQQGDRAECDAEGPPYAVGHLTVVGDGASCDLGRVALNGRGAARLSLRSHLDALDTSRVAGGRFALRFGSRTVPGDVWYASARHIATELNPFGSHSVGLHNDAPAHLPVLPGVGSTLSIVGDLFVSAKPHLSVARLLDYFDACQLSEKVQRPILANLSGILRLAEVLDGTTHDVRVAAQLPHDVEVLLEWLKAPTIDTPACASRLRIARWRDEVERRQRFAAESADAEGVIREWQRAVLQREPSVLAARPHGHALTDAARRYCEAMNLAHPKGRNQALNGVISTLIEVRRSCGDSLVVAVAYVIEQLARRHSGRPIEPSTVSGSGWPDVLGRAVYELECLGGAVQTESIYSSIGIADISPWRGDAEYVKGK